MCIIILNKTKDVPGEPENYIQALMWSEWRN